MEEEKEKELKQKLKSEIEQRKLAQVSLREGQDYLQGILNSLGDSFVLVIDKEGFFSKVAQALGYDDIDFESHEFSRKFRVRAPNKKFAYDVCNGRMIEYLLSNSDLSIEIQCVVMAISFKSRLSPDYIDQNLHRLITVRSLMLEYLFSGS